MCIRDSIYMGHMKETLRRAAEHKGTAYVEIYQNCNIFNDKAFAYMTDKELRDQQTLRIEHGKPLVFGKDQEWGIQLRGTDLEVIELKGSTGPEDCLVWDEDRPNPALAFLLAQLGPPNFPTPIGVFRAVDSPAYDAEVVTQIEAAVESRGHGRLEDLIYSGDIWEVGEDGEVGSL